MRFRGSALSDRVFCCASSFILSLPSHVFCPSVYLNLGFSQSLCHDPLAHLSIMRPDLSFLWPGLHLLSHSFTPAHPVSIPLILTRSVLKSYLPHIAIHIVWHYTKSKWCLPKITKKISNGFKHKMCTNVSKKAFKLSHWKTFFFRCCSLKFGIIYSSLSSCHETSRRFLRYGNFFPSTFPEVLLAHASQMTGQLSQSMQIRRARVSINAMLATIISESFTSP